MKCPKCGMEMKEVGKDVTANHKNGQKYSKTVFHCEMDDVWVGVEIPKTS